MKARDREARGIVLKQMLTKIESLEARLDCLRSQVKLLISLEVEDGEETLSRKQD